MPFRRCFSRSFSLIFDRRLRSSAFLAIAPQCSAYWHSAQCLLSTTGGGADCASCAAIAVRAARTLLYSGVNGTFAVRCSPSMNELAIARMYSDRLRKGECVKGQQQPVSVRYLLVIKKSERNVVVP